MAEPKDMVVPMLMEMRAAIDKRFDSVDQGFDGVDSRMKAIEKRLDTIDGRQKSFNNALTADTMMSKFVTGDFEGRIDALEKKVDELMKRN
ncbi:hypothetical protein [Hoeflea sp.]|uniref:hypothetical protein n=1 Tax=Hoeflea sp. TaxID=1940281 RepID=UPI0019B8B795|nr:hypothetical protein [Hoeflea sp.]MBC7284758.1 hypothetical protein [Hoeflea sp.]